MWNLVRPYKASTWHYKALQDIPDFFGFADVDNMHSIHPVFHVSMLEPSTPNTIPGCEEPPLPPVIIDGESEFIMSEILDSKIDNRHRTCKLLYLVKWAGYDGTDEETSWLLATELGHAQEVVDDFHKAYLNKPGPLASL